MTRKQKRMLCRILLATAFLVVLGLSELEGFWGFGLYLIPYFIVGYDILWEALRGLWNRQLLDENFLMAVATVGALVLGLTRTGDYVEAVAVMLFYQIGELFQSYAVGKSRKSITALMDIRPEHANVETPEGLVQVDPEELPVGSVIVVLPGERIPLDGEIMEGSSTLNTAPLTGESLPREVAVGDKIYSGCINITGLLKLRTTCIFEDSTVAKILDLVENASSRKSKSEHFISRFARVYTPAVCISALALCLLPPLFSGLVLQGPWNWGLWLYRALTFLVISCPCALVISIPLSFFAGLGGASKAGILIKGSNYLEALSKTEIMVFDKTGTLTQGRFTLSSVEAVGLEKEELLEYTAIAESSSTHPIALALREAWGKASDPKDLESMEEYSGKGLSARIRGRSLLLGNRSLLQDRGIPCKALDVEGTVVYVAMDGVYVGAMVLSDKLKDGAVDAMQALKEVGVKKTVLLSGDRRSTAEAVAQKLRMDACFGELLPGDKVQAVETLLEEKAPKKVLAFVGDGINDAPVLSRADIGIAMGAMGSDAAIESADVVLMDDDVRKLPKAIAHAKRCMGIVYQNTAFAIGIKVGCLLLGAVGLANMWLAIFADVGVMVLAVLNAIRALRVKD